jgi:hypothetical protein
MLKPDGSYVSGGENEKYKGEFDQTSVMDRSSFVDHYELLTHSLWTGAFFQ